MAGILEQGLMTLQNQFNLVEIVLPFILVFAIIFAVLAKVDIFGKKQVNVLIALVLALIVVFQHVFFRGPGKSVVDIINGSLPQIALIIIAVVMLMLILGVFGAKIGLGQNSLSGWIMAIAAIVVLYVFLAASGVQLWGSYWFSNQREIVSIVIAILIFALVIGYVTRDDKDNSSKKKFGEQIAELLNQGGK